MASKEVEFESVVMLALLFCVVLYVGSCAVASGWRKGMTPSQKVDTLNIDSIPSVYFDSIPTGGPRA
jgi:hypothetical protein